MSKSLQEQKEAFADLIVKVGLNLQTTQNLLIRASTEAIEFTRLVAERAYHAGCPRVDVIWRDEQLNRSLMQYSTDSDLSHYPDYLAQGHIEAANRGDAILSIMASDPEASKGLDGDRIAASEQATRAKIIPFFEKISDSSVNWCLVSVPSQAWAAKVFPDIVPELQEDTLWQAIFDTVRVGEDNPEQAWQEHLDKLELRREYLDTKRYAALHYKSSLTDLKVGLVEGHLWMGGIQPTKSGIIYVANLPTEEVFTMPHKDKVNGVVKSTLPLSYSGSLIEDFSLTFKDGVVVEATAKQGDDVLRRLLDTDEGARRLGEVALVPHSSPISQSGILFYDTLFDENAASHFALGRAYPFTIKGSDGWSQETAESKGVNYSLTHVDFMVGSHDMQIDGELADGSKEPLMRDGEFVF